MYILTLHCDDKPGIVAAVAGCLSNHQCNIEDSSQFNDKLSGQFFMRVVFSCLEDGAQTRFAAHFSGIADEFSMAWSITDEQQPVKALILVSKADHCLNDILYRVRTNHLNIEIAAVVSNHDNNRDLVESRNIPFHYLPIEEGNKGAQEQKIQDIIKDTGAELIVLARYMQILSNDLCTRYQGQIINIHHSFLPGFKGAKPYHQAYERGVKLIGATAHFATADLDEGPIIEQDVVRISHREDPKSLQALGRDTESKVLARAIELYAQRRIFLHGPRTVIL